MLKSTRLAVLSRLRLRGARMRDARTPASCHTREGSAEADRRAAFGVREMRESSTSARAPCHVCRVRAAKPHMIVGRCLRYRQPRFSHAREPPLSSRFDR